MNRAWRYPSTTSCVRMSSTSRGIAVLSGKGLAGIRVRLRAEWRGDTENAARTSEWRYVKFVR